MRFPPDSPQAQAFVSYLFENVAQAMERWEEATARDAYAAWLMLSLAEDDVRHVEVSGIGYATNTESERERAEAYGSRWSPGCIAHETLLSLCHPSDAEYVALYGIEDRHDPLGVEMREAYLDAVVSRFDRSETEKQEVWEHSDLQYKLNQDPRALSPQGQARLDELARKYGLTPDERAALRSDNRVLPGLHQEAILGAFLDACGEVIRRIHASGVLERKCGRAIPVGLTFSNDVDARVALEAVRDANPPGLSREMEEEMMGRTYAQIEAEEALHRQLAVQTPDEQADFWAELLIAGATPEPEPLSPAAQSTATPSTAAQSTPTQHARERAQELGLLGFGAVWTRAARQPAVAARVISRLLPLIEAGASPLFFNAFEDKERAHQGEAASSLLSALIHIGQTGDNREAVSEDDVERLHTLLRRLFRESESLERVGTTTFLVARALHALRPGRFPREKFGGGGETANRLLNYRDFGLSKSDPSTPDYDEAADQARRQSRRSGFFPPPS